MCAVNEVNEADTDACRPNSQQIDMWQHVGQICMLLAEGEKFVILLGHHPKLIVWSLSRLVT